MAQRRRNRPDWVEDIDWEVEESPYRDYGWESGQSALPEFRDPSVHLTPWEMEKVRRTWGPGDAERRQYISGYDQSRQRRGSQSRYGRFDEQRRRGTSDRGYDYSIPKEEVDYDVESHEYIPGPYSGIGPRGYKRSDNDIYEDVCERLTLHGQIDASLMEIAVHEGEVTIKGEANDRWTKRMVEDVAESVPGVFDVHNQLRINRSASGRPGGGAGRREDVRGSGVYPASGPLPEGDAEVEGMAGWGQGERGAKGYYDHGESEVQTLKEDIGDEEKR